MHAEYQLRNGVDTHRKPSGPINIDPLGPVIGAEDGLEFIPKVWLAAVRLISLGNGIHSPNDILPIGTTGGMSTVRHQPG